MTTLRDYVDQILEGALNLHPIEKQREALPSSRELEQFDKRSVVKLDPNTGTVSRKTPNESIVVRATRANLSGIAPSEDGGPMGSFLGPVTLTAATKSSLHQQNVIETARPVARYAVIPRPISARYTSFNDDVDHYQQMPNQHQIYRGEAGPHLGGILHDHFDYQVEIRKLLSMSKKKLSSKKKKTIISRLMRSIFDEIVQRADKLHTDVRLGTGAELRIPASSTAASSEPCETVSFSPALLDAGLDDVFRRSEDIWSRKQSLRPVTVGMGATLKTSRALSQLSASRLPMPKVAEKPSDGPSADYEDINADVLDGRFADAETNKFVQRAIERARIEAERTFLNQQILERRFPPRDTVMESVRKLNSKEVEYIWSKVMAIFPVTVGDKWHEKRSSQNWMKRIIDNGTKFLQNEFEFHMESTIEANLERARRGGVPGTLSRIVAYLNVKTPSHSFYEDGLHDHHPVWTLLFYCLRVGDMVEAGRLAKEAKELSNNPHCASLVGILRNLPKDDVFTDERRLKLRAEWNAQNCRDLHKKAIYGLFLGFDSPEVNGTIEDWLWSKMFHCKFAVDPTRALRQLQTTLCTQHGERYFVDEGGSHLLYFSVLLLTGQIERAVHVLFKSDYRVHSVHMAILAHQLRLVMTTEK
uniref:Nuclear pore protein n=1 Tax=Globodera pallida TaxID=36090 RepID=A0A183CHR4_GLOPA